MEAKNIGSSRFLMVEGKSLQSVDCQFSRNEVEHND
jgi:hypothetical protein